MGAGTFNIADYRAYAASTAGKTTDEIYTSRSIHKNLDPKGVKLRESRDSADNPNSTPIIVALDVTGSMGIIADTLAREGLGTLFREILDSKPVHDPHLMFMAVGDVHYDSAPLQVSQFEADNRIVEQLTQIFIEHGGGGNSSESYNLPWYFAARHTEHDSIIKRGKRGYLFTIGDEEVPEHLTVGHIREVFGYSAEGPLDNASVLVEAMRKYDIYHVVVLEGDYASKRRSQTLASWTNVLGQHVLPLSDHKKIAETIVAAISVAEGVAIDKLSRLGSAATHAVRSIKPAKRPALALGN